MGSHKTTVKADTCVYASIIQAIPCVVRMKNKKEVIMVVYIQSAMIISHRNEELATE